MKSLGLIVVLGVGVLAMLLSIVPLGISMHTLMYPQRGETKVGGLQVGEITVENKGFFTRAVGVPNFVACVGDQEIALDAYVQTTGSDVVKGTGQLRAITVRAGEQGTIYLIARDITIADHVLVYHRSAGFSCLTPGSEPLSG